MVPIILVSIILFYKCVSCDMNRWLQPIELHRQNGDSGLSASLKLRFHFYKAVARDTNQEAYRLSGGTEW